MVRKKAVASAGPRRARLAFPAENNVSEANNGVSLDKIKQAAVRAARLASADVSTILFDFGSNVKRSSSEDSIFKVPPPQIARTLDFFGTSSLMTEPSERQTMSNSSASTAEAVSQEREEATNSGDQVDANPLAALLGYGDNDESLENSESAAPPLPAETRVSSPPDNLDDQLANFMEELESSGLLANDDTHDPRSDIKTDIGPTANIEGDESSFSQPGAEPEDEPTTSGTAEQRVLGPVTDLPDWFEVMDMGSRKVYFWNSATNEVKWEKPGPSASVSPAAVVGEVAVDSCDQDSSPSEQNCTAVVAAAAAHVEPVEANTTEEDIDVGALQKQAELNEADEVAANLVTQQSDEEVLSTMLNWYDQIKTSLGSKLDDLPSLLKFAIELELRIADYRELAKLQGYAAVTERIFTWQHYKQHVLDSVDHLQQAISASRQESSSVPEHSVAAEGNDVSLPNGVSTELPTGETELEEGELANETDVTTDVEMEVEEEPEFSHPPLPCEVAPPLPADATSNGALAGDAAAAYHPVYDTADATSNGALADDAAAAYNPVYDTAESVEADYYQAYSASTTSDFYTSQAAAIEYCNSSLQAVPTVTDVSQPKRKEYRAEPVRAVTPEPPEEQVQPAPQTEFVEHHVGSVPQPVTEKRKREKVVVSTGLLSKKKKVTKAAKAASSLINKWQAVKRDLEDKELADDTNPEELQRRKQKELEQWRFKQLQSGAAGENANFQPLAVDWRAKVKAARDVVADGSHAKEVRASSPASTAVTSDVDELSKGLPSGWRAFKDPESGNVYYGNLETRETSWERPTG